MKTDVRAPTRLDSLMWEDVFNSSSKGELYTITPCFLYPEITFPAASQQILYIQCEIQRKNISLKIYFFLMSSLPSKG